MRDPTRAECFSPFAGNDKSGDAKDRESATVQKEMEKDGRSYGAAILVSVLLMSITMGLHPVGGDIDHLIRVTPLIVFTHTIAIISVPVLIYGSWGLSRLLGSGSGLVQAAFITFSAGLAAVLGAAALNGLAVPIFVSGLADANERTLETASLILRYGFSLNQAFDVIFIIFACGAVILWSVAILRTRRLPAWLAVIGLVAGASALVTLAGGYVLTDLRGFRIFMAGFILWLLLAGVEMVRKGSAAKPH